MSLDAPRKFTYGQHVKLLPLEDMRGRIIKMMPPVNAVDSWEYEVRYFTNGESRIVQFFEDELEAA